MSLLPDERLKPTLYAVGLLPRPLAEVAAARRELGSEVGERLTVVAVQGSLAEFVARLRPPEAGVARELFVACRDGWTALFDDAPDGTDGWEATALLAERLGCRALHVSCEPLSGGLDRAWMGLAVFAPSGDEEAEVERLVEARFDQGSWTWTEEGEPLEFEEMDRNALLPAERLTSELLRRYCRELGADPFDEAFYGRDAVLVRSE
jgi:hypothetical protein